MGCMSALIFALLLLVGCATSRVEVWTRGAYPICRGSGDPTSENVMLSCEDGGEIIAPWSRVERTGPRSGVVDLP